jgi:hypothetical protein
MIFVESIFSLSFLASAGSIIDVVKNTEIESAIVKRDVRHPLLPPLGPIDANNP